jgi:hypothetical protein
VRRKRGNRKLVCSGCGRRVNEIHKVYEREVRDLPCFEYRTTLVIELCRVRSVIAGAGVSSSVMTATEFIGSTAVNGCTLAEGGTASILPFPVDFNSDRGLWYCDITLSASQTPSAFARLALVRWQPRALVGTDDARLSQAVLADFMQIAPDRWVCVQKIDSKHVSVAVSGVFRTPQANGPGQTDTSEHTISCSIEQGWHRLGKGIGWRPVCSVPAFSYQAPEPGSNISCWSATIVLPHSTTFYKFRLLLEEHEWYDADSTKTNTGPPGMTRKSRITYLHYIEL